MDFPDFGKYAFYVWTSYGIAAFVLIANVVMPIMQRKEMLKTLNRKLRREQQS